MRIRYKYKGREKKYKQEYYQIHKEYISKRNQEYRKTHRKQINQQIKKLNQKNKLQWLEFFKKQYGEYPKCQVCGRELQWKGTINNVVCFDHKYDNEASIKNTPSQWVVNRTCNEKNQKIWLACDFGILCRECNKRLPTKNRKGWIRNVIKYIKKEEK